MAENAMYTFLDTERVVVPQMWFENHSLEDVRMQVQWAIATFYLENNPDRFVTMTGLFPQGYLAVNDGVHHFMLELDFHTWYNTRYGDEGLHEPMEVGVEVEITAEVENNLPGPPIRDEYGNMLPYDEMQIRLEPCDVPGYVMFKENIFIPQAWADLFPRRLIKKVIFLTIGQAHMGDFHEPIYMFLQPGVVFTHCNGQYWFLTEADHEQCQRSTEMAAEVEQQQQQQQQEDQMMEYQSEDDSGFGSMGESDDNDDSGFASNDNDNNNDSDETSSLTSDETLSEITDSDYSEIMDMEREE